MITVMSEPLPYGTKLAEELTDRCESAVHFANQRVRCCLISGHKELHFGAPLSRLRNPPEIRWEDSDSVGDNFARYFT